MEVTPKILPTVSELPKISSRGDGRFLNLQAVLETFETTPESGATHTPRGGLSVEAIIGIAVGCVCALLLAIIVVYVCIRQTALKKKKKQFERGVEPPRLVVELNNPPVHSGGRMIAYGQGGPTRTQDCLRGDNVSEYGSVGGSPPSSPTPSWKSASSSRGGLEVPLDRSRPGSFETCYSLSSSYGSARSYVSRKSRATLASFKSAMED